MFYQLNMQTITKAKIEKTFTDYFSLKRYETDIKQSFDIVFSEITCFNNESEYKQLLNEKLNQALTN